MREFAPIDRLIGFLTSQTKVRYQIKWLKSRLGLAPFAGSGLNKSAGLRLGSSRFSASLCPEKTSLGAARSHD
jgi:hypothetical protein